MKYRAKRSFYGDLGSVRRNQELVIADTRIAEQLLRRGLIIRASGDDETAATPKNKSSKPKGGNQ